MSTLISFHNSSKSNVLASRLQAAQQAPKVMYSREGSEFQEWAIRLLDTKGSLAYKAIGRFVTAINNGQMTTGQAEQAYFALLGK